MDEKTIKDRIKHLAEEIAIDNSLDKSQALGIIYELATELQDISIWAKIKIAKE